MRVTRKAYTVTLFLEIVAFLAGMYFLGRPGGYPFAVSFLMLGLFFVGFLTGVENLEEDGVI